MFRTRETRDLPPLADIEVRHAELVLARFSAER